MKKSAPLLLGVLLLGTSLWIAPAANAIPDPVAYTEWVEATAEPGPEARAYEAKLAAPGSARPAPAGTNTQVKKGDPLCRKARKKTKKPGRCGRKIVERRNKVKKLSARMVARYGYLEGSNTGTTLREAAALPAPPRCRTWYQKQHGLYYVNWVEKHTGKFCFNGYDVWVSPKRGGYHRCGQSSAYGYDVEVKNCKENRINVDTVPGYGVQNWDYYKISMVFKGFPIHWSYDMHTNVYPSGNAYFYWN